MVSLSDYKDAKGYIVIFTCNTCPYAKMYEDRIIELANDYNSKDFPVIAINPNDVTKKPGDSFDAMKQQSSKKSYPFPYLYDESQEVAKAFGATKTPHVYVVDKKMKVAYIGAIDDDPQDASAANTKYVRDAADAVIEGKKLEKTTSKAIGCTIKWKDA